VEISDDMYFYLFSAIKSFIKSLNNSGSTYGTILLQYLTFQIAVLLVSCPKQTVNTDDVQAAYHGLRHRRIQKYTVKSFIIRIPRIICHWVDQNSVTKMWGSFNTSGGGHETITRQ
jgi:hypothetical protein